jgi:hypothetical protein
MKEPDPTDDLDQTILDTFDKMNAEAQITPIFLTLPPEVIESVGTYAKEHSLEPATIPLAISRLRKNAAQAQGGAFDCGLDFLKPLQIRTRLFESALIQGLMIFDRSEKRSTFVVRSLAEHKFRLTRFLTL